MVSENIVALKERERECEREKECVCERERERECERWLRISDAILSTRPSKNVNQVAFII